MAKIRKFKCSKCGRTFSMAAHLARHQNTIHASKTGRKLVRKKTAKRARRRPVRTAARARAGRRPAAGAAGVMRQMRVYRQSLAARRAQLDSQIRGIDQALSALGASARPRTRRAARVRRAARGRRGARPRKGSLKDFIGNVLRVRKGPVAVKDVTAAVLKAGFKTKNKTLAKSVGIALSQMPGVMKVSRGLFRLR